ncbi:hypothetical protein ABZ490_51490 [Streptomyces sp. NPDC005811]|uniref:hypothetical protein n=1 Tax=Streptomyces sp. NPDC005811 TaxID=3154565 RepID=UPI0033D2EC74
MNDVMPEGEAIRLFTVPITPELAQEVAAILARFRELADDTLRVQDPEAFEQNTTSLLRREAAEIDGLSEPLRTERQSLHALLLETAELTTSNALDHVRALEHDILMQPPPVWSPLTLSRVVLEGVLFAEYLLDATIPLNKRLARLAGMWMTDATHSQKLADAIGPEDQAKAADMLVYVKDCLQKCQASERHNASGKLIGYVIDGETAAMDMNITERASKAMPSWLPAPYRLTSGAAHNRPWMIGRARNTAGDGGLVGEAATIMAAAMVAMGAVEAVVDAFGEYFGVDVSEGLREMEDERIAFFYRALALAHGQ